MVCVPVFWKKEAQGGAKPGVPNLVGRWGGRPYPDVMAGRSKGDALKESPSAGS